MAGIRRILMFIPGNNPAMIGNSLILGADSVVFDLEDAIALEDKNDARFLVREALKTFNFGKIEPAIRINGVTTEYWEEDLNEIVPCKPSFIQLPKVEHSYELKMVIDRVAKIEEKCGIPVGTVKVGPILETALGIENAFEIAKTCTDRLAGLFFGAEDFVANICGIRTLESKEIMYARQRLVVAARAVGLSPSDTAYINVDNDESLIEDCTLSKTLGFDGRAIVSPRQVKLARSLYLPSQKEIDYAREVMAVIEDAKIKGRGAITLHGKMIDEPIAKRARLILEAAEDL